MKAKHDFPDQESYKDYLKTYISVKAMQSLLLDINLEEELDPNAISTAALDMANSLIDKLLDVKSDASQPIVLAKEKPIDSKPIKNAARQEAEDFMKMGNALFTQKAYKAALANYLKANEIFPHKSTDNAIEQCNKWIGAVGAMEVIGEIRKDEPKPVDGQIVGFKLEPEFNYNIPTLES